MMKLSEELAASLDDLEDQGEVPQITLDNNLIYVLKNPVVYYEIAVTLQVQPLRRHRHLSPLFVRL